MELEVVDSVGGVPVWVEVKMEFGLSVGWVITRQVKVADETAATRLRRSHLRGELCGLERGMGAIAWTILSDCAMMKP